MSTRTYTITFNSSGTAPMPAGVFFYVKAATAALTIETRGSTSAPIKFENVGAGLKFGPVAAEKRWTYLDVTSAVAQTVELVISDDAEVDIASTVSVSGSVSVAEVPSSTLSTPAASSINNASALSIAANGSRKRITICALSTNTGNVYVQAAGAGAGRGFELQPGTFVEVKTTAAIDVRNDSGAVQNVTQFEES